MTDTKKPLGITDVILRDAHQSLLATRMRLDDMLPIAEKLDKVGFWSLESWGGATFDSCIRYLGEDPWHRIRSLKAFSTEGFTINGKQPDETPATKRKTAFFFLVHYGFFHVVYFIFLNIQHPFGALPEYDWVFLSLCILGFVGSHFYSYRYNATRDFRDRKPNIGSLMFYPYLRILPMHLTIVIGAGSTGVASLLMFMMLKTLADMGMHVVEHRLFRQSAQI